MGVIGGHFTDLKTWRTARSEGGKDLNTRKLRKGRCKEAKKTFFLENVQMVKHFFDF
jgi:hypothetical protein